VDWELWNRSTAQPSRTYELSSPSCVLPSSAKASSSPLHPHNRLVTPLPQPIQRLPAPRISYLALRPYMRVLKSASPAADRARAHDLGWYRFAPFTRVRIQSRGGEAASGMAGHAQACMASSRSAPALQALHHNNMCRRSRSCTDLAQMHCHRQLYRSGNSGCATTAYWHSLLSCFNPCVWHSLTGEGLPVMHTEGPIPGGTNSFHRFEPQQNTPPGRCAMLCACAAGAWWCAEGAWWCAEGAERAHILQATRQGGA
jgi:hypothetical protein